MSFKEISFLIRVREPYKVVAQQLTRRRLLYKVTPEQEAVLMTQGASEALLKLIRDPRMVYSEVEAKAYAESRKELAAFKTKAEEAKAAERSERDEYQTLNVPLGKPVNLSQWGGPNNDITFYAKREFVGDDLILAILTDNTRTFTDTVATTGASSGIFGASASTTTVQSSYSPSTPLTIDKTTPLLIAGLPTLYRVYQTSGVSVYFCHISTEAADSVKIAIRTLPK